MPYPIERKLVVGVSSNALFDMRKELSIFKNKGLEAFSKYQEEKRDVVLNPGMAFPFIKRLLKINDSYKEDMPVEVVLLSKNNPQTGIRVFNSIKQHGLNISKAVFTSGKSPYHYMPAYNICLFLSVNSTDVVNAIQAGYPAGKFVSTDVEDKEDDIELRVAFDFDGVIADDNSERIYKESKDLDKFIEYEIEHIKKPHNPGPLAEFFKKLAFFQEFELKRKQEDVAYKKILRTAIITAREAPAHERAINTLSSWGVTVDEMFLMGGVDKSRVLNILKPHIYFDDQMVHLDSSRSKIPLVHIPFGVANKNILASMVE
ncbi:MAG: 5'-nucleotidase [Bacteroidales bacterium]